MQQTIRSVQKMTSKVNQLGYAKALEDKLKNRKSLIINDLQIKLKFSSRTLKPFYKKTFHIKLKS